MGDGWIKEGDSVNLWSYTLLFDVSSFGNWIGAHLLLGIAFLVRAWQKEYAWLGSCIPKIAPDGIYIFG